MCEKSRTLSSSQAIPWFEDVSTKEGFAERAATELPPESIFPYLLELGGETRLRRSVCDWLLRAPRGIDQTLAWLVQTGMLSERDTTRRSGRVRAHEPAGLVLCDEEHRSDEHAAHYRCSGEGVSQGSQFREEHGHNAECNGQPAEKKAGAVYQSRPKSPNPEEQLSRDNLSE